MSYYNPDEGFQMILDKEIIRRRRSDCASGREGLPDPVLHDDPRGFSGAGRLLEVVKRVFRIVRQPDAKAVRCPKDLREDSEDPLRPGGGKEGLDAGKRMQFFDGLECRGHQNDPARLMIRKG